jgi:copper chaperone CopZ
MQILHFAVPGMSFDACVTDLTGSLRRIPRVHLVSVDPWTESVVVTGRLLDERRVLAAISAAGFEALTHGRGGPVTYDAHAPSRPHLIPGLLDRGSDGVVIERFSAVERQEPSPQVHIDRADAVDLGDLLPHGPDTVVTGHSGHGIGPSVHDSPFLRS